MADSNSNFVVATIIFLKDSIFWCVHVNVPWPVCAHAIPFRMLWLPRRVMITYIYIYICKMMYFYVRDVAKRHETIVEGRKHIHVRIHEHFHTLTLTHIHIHVHMRIHTYTNTRACTCAFACACARERERSVGGWVGEYVLVRVCLCVSVCVVLCVVLCCCV